MNSVHSVASTQGQPLGRRDRRKAEMRSRIVDASLDLFTRQDYLDTTVEQITEAADVGKGTFFSYFASKERALDELAVRQLARVESAVDTALKQGRPERDTMREILHGISETPGKSRRLMRNLLVGTFSSEHSCEHLRSHLEAGMAAMVRLIERERAAGTLLTEEGARAQAQRFFQIYTGVIVMWTIQPDVHLHDWLDHCFDHYWASISTVPS